MTHDDRVLDLLLDGREHSHLEIYDLRVVAHSRVASLRKKGYVIECRRAGDLYVYRLDVDALDATADPQGGSPLGRSVERAGEPEHDYMAASIPACPADTVPSSVTDGVSPVALAGQLTIEAVA